MRGLFNDKILSLLCPKIRTTCDKRFGTTCHLFSSNLTPSSIASFHVTLSFSKIENYQSFWSFSFIRYKDPLRTWRFTTFKRDRVSHFVIMRGRFRISKYMRDIKMPLEKVKRGIVAHVFSYWTVLELLSVCRNSRVTVLFLSRRIRKKKKREF